MPARKFDNVQVGTRFERLVICGEVYFKTIGNQKGIKVCPCRCDCGNELEVRAGHLISGNTKSCGCLQRERTSAAATTHGDSRDGTGHSLLYNVWCAMKDRCGNPKNKRFDRYGGRGIMICDEWINDFAAFRDWAKASGYREGLTIERREVDGNYEPSNCTWIPAEDQAKNRTTRCEVTAFGETKSVQEWVDDPRCVVCRMTFYYRLRLGWDAERALITPSQRKGSVNPAITVKQVKA
jgi:hypothetical protein